MCVYIYIHNLYMNIYWNIILYISYILYNTCNVGQHYIYIYLVQYTHTHIYIYIYLMITCIHLLYVAPAYPINLQAFVELTGAKREDIVMAHWSLVMGYGCQLGIVSPTKMVTRSHHFDSALKFSSALIGFLFLKVFFFIPQKEALMTMEIGIESTNGMAETAMNWLK